MSTRETETERERKKEREEKYRMTQGKMNSRQKNARVMLIMVLQDAVSY